MADEPLSPLVDLSRAEAETILAQWLGRATACTGLRRLTGGCVSTVFEVAFDAPASPAVLKIEHGAGQEHLGREFDVLAYHRAHTRFRVPEPLFRDSSGALLPYSYFIMERLPGDNLGAVTLAADQHQTLEREMAAAVADLHAHTRPLFGRLAEEEGDCEDWATYFGEMILDLYREPLVAQRLSTETMAQTGAILEALPRLLDAPCKPTLVHGDIWATNIMVNDGRLAGFLDPSGFFAHREYELAYLEIWGTVGDAFFGVYHDAYPRLEGYERRRLAYWLHTLLLHVWLFGAEGYIRRATEVARRLHLQL